MILFMGVAGSGKSTQGRLLADTLALPWLAAGEFLRMLITGEKRTQMLRGKLLDDQEIIAVMRKVFTIVDTSKEFVLDGFPRTVGQADWLLGQVKQGRLAITVVVHLIASEDVVKQRLMARGRQDDHSAAIAERLNEYKENILPILVRFRSAGLTVHEIDGERPVPEVREAVLAAVRGTLCIPE